MCKEETSDSGYENTWKVEKNSIDGIISWGFYGTSPFRWNIFNIQILILSYERLIFLYKLIGPKQFVVQGTNLVMLNSYFK